MLQATAGETDDAAMTVEDCFRSADPETVLRGLNSLARLQNWNRTRARAAAALVLAAMRNHAADRTRAGNSHVREHLRFCHVRTLQLRGG
jgi:hypothetical protein